MAKAFQSESEFDVHELSFYDYLINSFSNWFTRVFLHNAWPMGGNTQREFLLDKSGEPVTCWCINCEEHALAQPEGLGKLNHIVKVTADGRCMLCGSKSPLSVGVVGASCILTTLPTPTEKRLVLECQ